MSSESKWGGRLSSAFFPVVLALCVGYFMPTSALGQGESSVGPQRQARRPLSGSSLDARVNQFARSLGLNEAQKSEVKKILERRQQESLRIRNDASIPGSARIDRFRTLQEKTVGQIRAVLNEEQRTKYNPLAPREIPRTPQPSVEDWIKATTSH